jgi:hypothetical protein
MQFRTTELLLLGAMVLPAFRGMLLEPRLHLAEGLEGLAQLRLINGVDIVILDSAWISMAGRRRRHCCRRSPLDI